MRADISAMGFPDFKLMSTDGPRRAVCVPAERGAVRGVPPAGEAALPGVQPALRRERGRPLRCALNPETLDIRRVCLLDNPTEQFCCTARA